MIEVLDITANYLHFIVVVFVLHCEAPTIL